MSTFFSQAAAGNGDVNNKIQLPTPKWHDKQWFPLPALDTARSDAKGSFMRYVEIFIKTC